MPPSGVNESCIPLTAPQLASSGDRGENRSARNAETKFLAFEISSSGCQAAGVATLRAGVGMCLGGVDGKHSSEEERGHCTPDGPAVWRVEPVMRPSV